MVLEFEGFRLDFHAQSLVRSDETIVLRRKTWEVLRYLSERPGKLVSRQELAEAVWGEIVVSDEVVTAAVRELRRAMGDTALPSRVIETIRGRGFRFVARLSGTDHPPPFSERQERVASPNLAGRTDALQQLHDAWEEAARSWQRIVFVTGSAGIGKTALVDSFLRDIDAGVSPGFAFGRGECGDGDYFAVLRAVEHLCRSRRGDDMLIALRRFAPEWIGRLNLRWRSTDRPTLSTRLAETSDEQLIAGILDAFTQLANDFPFVLVLEDLHRCDPRTRTLLRRLALRYDAARLLVIGTYRTDAAGTHTESLRASWEDLVSRGKAREIALAPLDREGVAAYLRERNPGLESARFVQWAYRQSRGNPSILRNAIDDLTTRDAVRRVDGKWHVVSPAKIGVDYAASSEDPPLDGTIGPFVGRDMELARLDSLWQRALSGQRHTVAVAGEPGMGKTAFVERFLAEITSGASEIPHVVVGKCTEQRSRAEAYMPMMDMLESWSRDDPSGEVAEQMLRLAPHWARQIPGTESDSSTASAWVAVDARPERMMREASALVEALARTRPVVLWLEDAHWADPATIDLLTYLATRTPRARLLILVTYRPVEAAAHPELLELRTRSDIERIDLRPLSATEVRLWLDSVFTHATAVVEHLVDESVRRSSGNPLFLQAVTRSLTTAGCVERTAEGWAIGTSELRRSDVPVELGGLIASQFRLLPTRLRSILDVASVAGEEFDGASVAGALGLPIDTVDADLSNESRRSFLILSLGSSVWPDGTASGRYRFRHALYQRALFDALPPHERARLHRSIASTLESGFARRLAPVTTEIAEHYSAGGDHAAAATHLEHSALLMIERSALREAIGYFERAIDALACVPDDSARRAGALRNHIGCGLSCGLLEGPQSDRVQHHTRAIRTLLPRVDDLSVIFPSVRLLWLRDLFSWGYANMTKAANELVRRSEEQADPAYRSLALSLRGVTACYRGEVNAARRDLEESLRLCDDPARLPSAVDWVIDSRVETRCYLSWMLWLSGFPDRSRRVMAESLRIAEDGGHESTRCAALWFAAAISQLRRDEIADEYVEILDDYSDHVGFAVWRQFAAILRAVAQLERGDERALDVLLATLTDASEQPSAVIARAYLLGQLASAYGRKGDPQHGILLIELALARISENGARVSESELLRIRGELQLGAGDPRTADTSFQAALRVARQQGSKAFELRAALARARLHRGSSIESATLIELNEVYGSFGDGFDSPELAEARTLLSPARPVATQVP